MPVENNNNNYDNYNYNQTNWEDGSSNEINQEQEINQTTLENLKLLDKELQTYIKDKLESLDGSPKKLETNFNEVNIPSPNPSVNTNTATNNPWFAVSYLAVLSMVLMELASLHSKQGYMESQNEIKMNKLSVVVAHDIADMTLRSYNNQAQEKVAEAISSFLNAAVSAMSLAGTFKNQATAKKNANADHKEKIDTAQKQFDDIAAKYPEIHNKSQNTRVGDKGDKVTERSDEQKLYDQAKANLSEAKLAEKQQMWKESELMNQRMNFSMEMIKGGINGSVAIWQSVLKADQGVAESTKIIYENELQLIRGYADKASKQADQAEQDFSQIMDLLKKITDSIFQSFSPRA